MAMVISPRSKIVTLSLLIGITTFIALVITGVIGFWHNSSGEVKPGNGGVKTVSSKLQQFTGYTATKHYYEKLIKLWTPELDELEETSYQHDFNNKVLLY
ncbi:hypothetical protein PV325_009643 [Microctonus aethiopoides]|nr:hypothetical protein PV325_009643 [Microctonus aethiopoides]